MSLRSLKKIQELQNEQVIVEVTPIAACSAYKDATRLLNFHEQTKQQNPLLLLESLFEAHLIQNQDVKDLSVLLNISRSFGHDLEVLAWLEEDDSTPFVTHSPQMICELHLNSIRYSFNILPTQKLSILARALRMLRREVTLGISEKVIFMTSHL
jgi:hypothetical protein